MKRKTDGMGGKVRGVPQTRPLATITFDNGDTVELPVEEVRLHARSLRCRCDGSVLRCEG